MEQAPLHVLVLCMVMAFLPLKGPDTFHQLAMK